jgi:hypothetical protein
LLTQGDLVQFSDSDNNLVRAVVQYATKAEGSSKTRVYLDTVLPGDVTNTSIVRLRPKLQNPNSGTLLFPTGSKQVEKISAGGDDTKIKYYFRRDFEQSHLLLNFLLEHKDSQHLQNKIL